jgi:hypothetical protein
MSLRRQPHPRDVEAVAAGELVRERDDAIDVRSHRLRELREHPRTELEVVHQSISPSRRVRTWRRWRVLVREFTDTRLLIPA